MKTPAEHYQHQLRSPHWQRRRLKELERAGFRCESCGECEKELQIHHLKYEEKYPWMVPPGWLEVLCEDCHKWREAWNLLFARRLISTKYCRQVIENGLGALLAIDTEASHDFSLNYKRDLLVNLIATLSNQRDGFSPQSADDVAMYYLRLTTERARERRQWGAAEG